jgi:uridine phosphorylase
MRISKAAAQLDYRMPFPNYLDKYGASAHLTPKAMEESRDAHDVEVPEAVVLCYQPSFFEYIVEKHAETKIEGLGDDRLILSPDRFYTLSNTEGRVGVLGNFGIGAPTTAIAMEQLIGFGTDTFCIVGGCGGLGSNATRHEPIVCNRAVRDEGVSHHYLPSEMYASASSTLVTQLENALDAAGLEHQTGSSWTTDAIYRETDAEIEHYRDEGVLAVEMEAATIFSIAEYRGVDAGALLCPLDLVMVNDWEPSGEPSVDGLRDLLVPARDALLESTDFS